jgi:hypothetical protein
MPGGNGGGGDDKDGGDATDSVVLKAPAALAITRAKPSVVASAHPAMAK